MRIKSNIIEGNGGRIALAIVFAALIFVSGCGLIGLGGNTNQLYYIGTDGVTMEFPTSNPKDVQESDRLSLTLRLKNIGAYSINESGPGRVSVTYDSYYLDFLPPLNPTLNDAIVLHGRDKEYPIGDEEFYQALFNVKPLTNTRDTIKTTIGFNICYPYQTELSIATCIDTKIYQESDTAVACKSAEYSSSNGQGGPVAITRIVPEMIVMNQENAIRPQFKIYVNNMGNGYVLNKSGNDVCMQDSIITKGPDNLNKLSIRAKLSNKDLVCTPAVLKLRPDQDNYFRCYATDTADYKRTNKNYIAPLTVTIEYGYVEVKTQDISIIRNQDLVVNSPTCGILYKEVNGVCIPLCTYCSANPGAPECQVNRPTKDFKFNQNFGCFCDETKCQALAPDGKCIFGYCPGNLGCCETNECDQAYDGSPCGDGFVCSNKKCTNITQCQWYEKTARAGYACRDSNSCGTFPPAINNFCPSKTGTVCCAQNPCQSRPDGTPCNTTASSNNVCIGQRCDDTRSYCEFRWGAEGFRCLVINQCMENTTNATMGGCPNDGSVCCKPSLI